MRSVVRHGTMVCALLVFALGTIACGQEEQPGPERAEDEEWPLHGRTLDEQRHSPLTSISDENVRELGLAWTYDTGENRKHEATPIVTGGVMYLTAPWSIVHALDARTGKRSWRFDPLVPKEWGRYACCGVVNRGVAVSNGHVYLGTLDGRLIKLAAASGEKIWDIDTIDRKVSYTITGAPRIVKDKVIIGNGGGEYGVRGYVSAYDADSGDLAWRFWTVPGDPSRPLEHAELEAAAKTWNGEWWKVGGGGTAWDSFAYDPELDLLYVGTGNGSPWARAHRSPGGGDNLYLSSILALDPDDGRMQWYYQTTPGDNWDYTATQHIVLADMSFDGEMRSVLMQAPKNGFFYVLDRATGELISAEKYAKATWATHVNLESGRPVEVAEANYDDQPRVIFPRSGGAHNWHPMSYHLGTGLTYIPARDVPGIFPLSPTLDFREGVWNLGLDFSIPEARALYGAVPRTVDYLLAWDPHTQSERWRVQQPEGVGGGGVLSTAGNLVFQGSTDGALTAYSADSGELLWRAETNVGIIAPPITYSIDGEQYVTVVAGRKEQTSNLAHLETLGRVLTFKLGADAQFPDVPLRTSLDTPIPAPFGSPDQVADGQRLYGRICRACHGSGTNVGAIPDLRYADEDTHSSWNAIVLDGARASRGMAGYGDVLSADEAQAIRSYVVQWANDTRPPIDP